MPSTTNGSLDVGFSKPDYISFRTARLIDHWAIARLNTHAFFDDVLFGRAIHPNRHLHPFDSDRYWLLRNLVAHFDYSHRFVVAVVSDEQGQERIVGQTHWSRIGLSARENRKAGWGLRPWDPRRLLRPITSALTYLASFVWRNRAADPATENIIEDSYGYLDHIWHPDTDRCPSLYLESMAVLPEYQGLGIGRKLLQEGFKMADRENISASVISADGKEGFYLRSGFDVGPVGRSGEGEGNPLWHIPGGLVFFRNPCRAAWDCAMPVEIDDILLRLNQDNKRGWPSIWMKEHVHIA
jgi:GNAT superfamily N-acetyltransferase